jgi:hypothetical protein
MQATADGSVTSFVRRELLIPIAGVRPGKDPSESTMMAVPKAAVDKYYFMPTPKHQVRCPRQCRVVHPITVPFSTNDASHDKFRGSVATTNLRHAEMPLPPREIVRHHCTALVAKPLTCLTGGL